eukprot:TRINITY_DN6981_c0_g1_i1.p1 TRINITY_DN6981_c0_g1~~TRINITY_DN6981_c0_g1_i1.p1  ORF type:complete len:213 (+),score=45.44 TRINITY_DN6981_c0_g1_i1:55-693(+)
MSSSIARPLIRIEIISDTVCPWCYVGKRRLEKAISSYSKTQQVDFQVEWHPFMLDPTLPKSGVDKRQRYVDKFGAQRVEMILPSMTQTGVEEGINFKWGGKVGNTFDSHRAIEWAKKFNKQNELVEILFRKYFEEEQNIGDIEVLVSAANELGLSGAREFLESPELSQEVAESVRKNRNVGGVPYFRVNQKFSMSGAQPADLWHQIFDRFSQ